MSDLFDNPAFAAHALTPCNLGILPSPQGYARQVGSCGDSLELYLRIEQGRIEDARFMPDGCMHTQACGSVLTELIKGADLSQAVQVDAQRIEQELGGLPREHRHCAVLAESALRTALRHYAGDKGASWKSLYRKR